MHRYQYNQSDIHGDHRGNIEIEAKLLVWDYLRSQYSENEIRSNFDLRGSISGSLRKIRVKILGAMRHWPCLKWDTEILNVQIIPNLK